DRPTDGYGLPLGAPPIPAWPLPDDCWDGPSAVVYTTWRGAATETARVDLATGGAVRLDPATPDAERLPRSSLLTRLEAKRRFTLPANPFLADRFVGEEQVVAWENEQLRLEGILTLPPAEVARPPFPVVVLPHGGPHSRSTLGFSASTQALAGQGYAVFQPNYRGTPGYGKRFLDADRRDLGGGDFRDVTTGVEELVRRRLVDPSRRFIYGSSYGGFLTCWAVGHTRQFRAAAAQNPVTHMDVMWGVSDVQSWTEWEMGAGPWRAAERMRRHSPFAVADQVVTPTLLLVSADDRRVPPASAMMYHQALLFRNVPTALYTYADEGHGLKQPRHAVDALQRTLGWFRRHDRWTTPTVMTLGDSITLGVRGGVGPMQTYPAQLQQTLQADEYDAGVVNVGVGGERTDQALARLDALLAEKQPHVVVVMYGTNDSYVDAGKSTPRLSVEQYRSNLEELVSRIQTFGAEVVLATPPRWGAAAKPNGLGEHPNVALTPFVKACRTTAVESGVPLVDHFGVWTAEEEKGRNLSAWTTDECHPNPEGGRVLADGVAPIVERLLSSRR
ncbi:MAG: SGNH/GDSL hydrolase family protein, partial [Planctomycetia bacterium]